MSHNKKNISKQVPAHKKIKSHKNMEKVKIKRVKREKKHATTKEKILAGIGVGGALMGGAGAVAPKSGQTQIVRTQESASKKNSKFKDTLKRIFGINTAKASVTQEYLDTLAANVNAAKAALASFDQWVTEATADAQNFGTQEERDNRLVEIQATVDSQRPALVSAQEAAESAYSTAADEFINQQNGGGGNGGGGGGTVITHSYTVNTADSLTVQKGAWGGMTFSIVDENGNDATSQGTVSVSGNGNMVDLNREGNTIQVYGQNVGNTTVTVTYRADDGRTFEKSFYVTVSAPSSVTPVSHVYTVNPGSSNMTVEKGAWGGMTYTIVDENGNSVSNISDVQLSGSGNFVDLSVQGNTVAIYGREPVNQTPVRIIYTSSDGRISEGTFYVTVTAPAVAPVVHTYTVATEKASLNVEQGSWENMNFTITDENGNSVSPASGVQVFGDGNIIDLNLSGNTVRVYGQQAGQAEVRISYRAADGRVFEKTFNVTVPGPAVVSPLAVQSTGQSMSVVAGEYREFNHAFSVADGSGNYSYSLSQAPSFIGINGSDGTIFVNSEATAGSYAFRVNVTDNQNNRTGSIDLAINIIAASTPATDPGTTPNYQAGNLANVPVTYVKASVNVMAHRTININGVGLVAVIESGQIYDENGQDITGKFSTEDQQKIYNAAYGSAANLQNPQDIPGASFTTASGQNITSGSSLKAGDSWKLQIKNYRAGASVTARTTFAGQTSDTNLGQTDSNGNFTFTGTETENEVGSWQVEFLVDGQSVVAANFDVVTAMKAMDDPGKTTNLGAGVTFTKNGASFTTLKVWEPWDISITGAKAGAQIVAQTTQVKPNGETKTSTRILGVTDSKGVLQITDTPTFDHIGSWTIQLLADGQPMGGTASFTVLSSTLGPAPLDSSGKLKAGWQNMGGDTYYNGSLGITSNGDGSVQGYTSDQYGKNLIEAGKVKAGVTNIYNQTVKEVYIYNNYDHTFQKANEGQFSTLDVANQMAAIFGGKVQAAQLDANGPYRFVNIGEFPAGQTELKQENLLPSYEVVVGKYRGNAAAMARLFLNNPYDYAVAQIQAEINAENNPTGQVNPSVTNAPKGGTQGTGTGAVGTGTTPTATGQGSVGTTANSQVSISSINSYDATGAASPTQLGAGYKVEIVGNNLQFYSKAYAIIGGSQTEITNFQVQNNKLTLTLPNTFPATIANGTTVNIKITSGNSSIPQGVLKNTWKYVATASSVGNLNLDSEVSDVDAEEGSNSTSSGGSSVGIGSSSSSSGLGSSGGSIYGSSSYSNNGTSGGFSSDSGYSSGSYGTGSTGSYNTGSYGGSSQDYSTGSGSTTYQTSANTGSTIDSEVENADEEAAADEEVENSDTANNNDNQDTNSDAETEVTDSEAGDTSSDQETEVTDSETDTTNSDQETENADEQASADEETESGDTENTDTETENTDSETENTDQETENADRETTDSGDNEMESVDTEDAGSGDQETENADEEAAADEEVENSDTANNNDNQDTNSDAETEVADSETDTSNVNKSSVADNEDSETEETDTDVAAGTGSGSGSGSSSSGGGGVYTLGGASQLAGNQFKGLQMPAGYGSSGGGLQYQAPADEETEVDAQAETDSDILGTYKVKKGDTLWKIAKKYYGEGRKWRKILEANTDKVKNTRTMKIGIELKIPKI